MEKEIDIELAKSWFALAQSVMILAGFLFASAGIFWSSAYSLLNIGVDLQLHAGNTSVIEPTLALFGTNLRAWSVLFCSGVIAVFISVGFWYVGYRKLNK